MNSCPRCKEPVSTKSFDPRNDSEVTYCPHCDTKLYHDHQESTKANMHFFFFIVLAFITTFYVGTLLVVSWGDDITLVAIPPILLLLLYISYRLFSIELEHVHYVIKEEKQRS